MSKIPDSQIIAILFLALIDKGRCPIRVEAVMNFLQQLRNPELRGLPN